MKVQDLLELGFVDKSYTDYEGNFFSEFELKHKDNFTVAVSGEDFVEICLDGEWSLVPGCETIEGIKSLISLF
jgi:hypothetical protein